MVRGALRACVREGALAGGGVGLGSCVQVVLCCAAPAHARACCNCSNTAPQAPKTTRKSTICIRLHSKGKHAQSYRSAWGVGGWSAFEVLIGGVCDAQMGDVCVGLYMEMEVGFKQDLPDSWCTQLLPSCFPNLLPVGQ